MKKIENVYGNKKSENIVKKILTNEIVRNDMIIFLISMIVSIPLTRGFIQGHDANPHIARVMSTVIALKSHQFLPMIASNYVNGLGYSWNLFYPPLTNYLTILLRIFCDSYTQALNMLVSFSIFISGIFMYHFSEKVSKSRKVGLLSAIVYMTVPYRISDIYVRYAIGEIISFMFIPLVFNGLYSILEDHGKRNYLLTIGAVGVLLTHNITTLLVMIVCAIFLILYIDRLKRWETIRDFLINAIFILTIVACFYGPFLESKNATDYAVFCEFASQEKLSKNTVNLWEILIGKLYFPDDVRIELRVSTAIGLIVCLCVMITPFIYQKIDKSKRRMYVTSLIVSLFCIFASSKYMPWQYMPEIFKFIQFPYRLLIIPTFLLSLIVAINLEKVLKNITYRKILLLACICLVYITPLLICTKVYENYDENRYYAIEKNENPYPGVYSDFCSTYEYLPNKAYHNLPYLFTRTRNPEVVVGTAEITDMQIEEDNSYTFHIENYGADSLKIEMPIMYYLGYTATLEGETLETEESNYGLLMLTIPREKSGTVIVTYTGTKISKACMIISCMSIFCFILYMIASEMKIHKNK